MKDLRGASTGIAAGAAGRIFADAFTLRAGTTGRLATALAGRFAVGLTDGALWADGGLGAGLLLVIARYPPPAIKAVSAAVTTHLVVLDFLRRAMEEFWPTRLKAK